MLIRTGLSLLMVCKIYARSDLGDFYTFISTFLSPIELFNQIFVGTRIWIESICSEIQQTFLLDQRDKKSEPVLAISDLIVKFFLLFSFISTIGSFSHRLT